MEEAFANGRIIDVIVGLMALEAAALLVLRRLSGRGPSALEIVVNGLDRAAIEQALRVGIRAACRPGVVEISAGNYGGKLGKHHFPLRDLL